MKNSCLRRGYFYSFNLERHIPADHLLRRIDAVLDLSEIRRALAPHYAAIGRPSVDPELMTRMLLIGYAFAIRSQRRLCEEVHLGGGGAGSGRCSGGRPLPRPGSGRRGAATPSRSGARPDSP